MARATSGCLHGKNIVHMTSGTDELHIFYDAQNRPAVVVYNGVPYAYVKSLQGDIVAILDENGNAVVSYGYDAWGAPLWCTGELAETLGKVQPFRYRGYVFDEETGLYYVSTRFYSAEISRFLSSDDEKVLCALSEDETSNLFAYCNNNPISLIDEEGTLGHIVIGAFVGALFELGSQIIDAEGDLSKVKWGKVAIAAVVGGVGAALPTLGGVITTTLGNLVTEALDGHRDAEHMLASIANGLITSLLGVGAGKLAAKVGGRIIAKVLSKQAPGRIKQVITSVMQIAGEDRNAVKDIAWALTKYKTLPEHLFGRSNEQLVNSMVSGVGSTIGSRWIHGN